MTERLSVGDWHSIAEGGDAHPELADVVVELLTPAVTANLPDGWSGSYSVERARKWIAERDDEGVALLAVERSSARAVGIMLLFEERADPGGERGRVDVRLGYLLGEGSWGRGFASELVAGFVAWCRDHEVASISGGVAAENAASERVLTKNGFREVPAGDAGVGSGEQLYRVDLTR